MRQPDPGVGEADALAVGVHLQRHHRAGPQPGEQVAIGRRPGVVAAHGPRLVGDQGVSLRGDQAGVLARAGKLDHDLPLRVDRVAGFGQVEVALGEGADHAGGVGGVLGPVEQVVGAIEGDEGLGVLGGDEDAGGIVDADGCIKRRMQHQQRGPHRPDARFLFAVLQVVEKLPRQGEAPATQLDLARTIPPDLVGRRAEVMQHVGGVEGRAEGGDRADALDLTRCADHRSAAERMPDQQAGGEAPATQVRGGGHDIGDVRAVVGIG